jgi:hypothetical protein
MTVTEYGSSGNLALTVQLSGSGTISPAAVAIDSSGNIWAVGFTTANDLQLVNPLQSELKGGEDAFVAEFNSAGTLIFSTYFGGSEADEANALALDGSGNVYFAGQTQSPDFPTMNPLESSLTGGQSAFLTKLDNAGHLLYSTYLGTAVGDSASGVGVDVSMNMFVAGGLGFNNAVKLNPSGSAVVYSVPGPNLDLLAVDGQGNAYITVCIATSVQCPFLPLVNPIQSDRSSIELVGLDPSGNINFSTYLGDMGNTFENQPFPTYIGVDSGGNIYADFETDGGPMPLLNAVNGSYPPPSCASLCTYNASFVAKITLGTGTSFSLPSTVDFIPTQLGQSSPVPIEIFNTGTTNIGISSIVPSGDYSQTNSCPATLNAATSCPMTITFTPTAGGARNGSITITDTAPGSPHVIQLTGQGAVPLVALTPMSLNFGSVLVGANSTLNVTLTNPGLAPLQVSRISTSGAFSEMNGCEGGIGSGLNCQISVTFTPTTTGVQTGAVTITDNAANSPQMIGLTGTGEAAGLALGVASGSSSSASVTAGDTATYKLTIGGQGVGGTATLSCSGVPTGATCSVPASVNVSATTASTVTVSVTTTAHNSALLVRPGAKLGWALAMGILGLVFLPGMSAGKWARGWVAFALLLFICSCGGGYNAPPSNQGGTPAGNYTLRVTANLGSSNQSLPLTLTVH